MVKPVLNSLSIALLQQNVEQQSKAQANDNGLNARGLGRSTSVKPKRYIGKSGVMVACNSQGFRQPA